MKTSAKFDLARFFWRARPARLAAILVALTAMVLFTVVTAVESLQLSGSQVALESLGRATAMVEFSGAAPLGERTTEIDSRARRSAAAAGAEQITVGYLATRMLPDGAVARPVQYREDNWASRPFPQQTLQQGRWPNRLGDAAVSSTMAKQWPLGSTIRFFNGRLSLLVVGVVTDDLGRQDDAVYAAPGTWDSLHSIPRTTAAQYGVAAARQIRWQGIADPAAVAKAIASVPGATGPQGEQGTDLETRASIETSTPRLYIELELVSLLAPLIGGFIGGIVAFRFTGRVRQTLWTVGVTWRNSRGAALGAVLGSSFLAGVAGVVIGSVVGIAIRPLINAFTSTALGPVHDLIQLGVTFVCFAVVGAGLAALITRKAGRPARATTTPKVQMPRYVLLIPVTVLAALGSFLVQGTSSVTQLLLGAFCFGGGVVILSPLALAGISRLQPSSMPLLFAVRRVAAERRSTSWIVVSAGLLILLSFGATTFYSSGVAAANAQNAPLVPHGQIELAPDDASASTSIKQRFEKTLRLANPVLVSIVDGSTQLGDGSTLAVATVADVSRILGVHLSTHEIAVLTKEGTLRTHADGRSSVVFTPSRGKASKLPAVTIAKLDSSFNNYDGYVLDDTVAHYHLDLVQPVWIYTGVPPQTENAAKSAAQRLGFNPSWVIVGDPPAAFAEPLKPMLIAAGIALLAGLVLMLVSAAEARALRPVLAGLRAVGVSASWLARALVSRAVAISALALLAAGIGGALGVGIALSIDHLPFGVTVPWSSLGIAIATTLTLTLVGVLTATRRLRSSERLG